MANSQVNGGALQRQRWPWLDGLRGVAILAMAIYHLTWNLVFFHFAPPSVLRTTFFVLFGHSIACGFLAIAGFALAIASRPHLDFNKFAWRLGRIAGAAMLVTIATYIIFPESYVNFGILHCIAAASVISVLFVRSSWWITALAGAVIFVAGSLIEWPMFDAVNGWIGLGYRIPLTNDWRPIFPWAGAMLLGLAFGQFALPRNLFANVPVIKPPPLLAAAGRHSLAIYLVHQPVLFALVWMAAQVSRN